MFVALERLINLQEGYRRTFQVNGQQLLLLVLDNQPLLIVDRCPHQGVALSLGSVQGNVLRCARHGFAFSLPDGQALQPGCNSLRVIALAYEGDRIGIDV